MVISGVKVSVILLIFLNERGRYNRQHAVRHEDFVCCVNLIHVLLYLTFQPDLLYIDTRTGKYEPEIM